MCVCVCVCVCVHTSAFIDIVTLMQGYEQDKIQVTQKKRELLKNPTKIEETQEKKVIDRN